MYVLPPNNAIAAITDLNRNDDVRAAIHAIDLKLQNREMIERNAGQGPGIDADES
jgi:hypothetical protein